MNLVVSLTQSCCVEDQLQKTLTALLPYYEDDLFKFGADICANAQGATLDEQRIKLLKWARAELEEYIFLDLEEVA